MTRCVLLATLLALGGPTGGAAGDEKSVTGESSFEKTHAGKSCQIEVGGPFAGVELHRSSIQPCRLSFFYPVANSVDLSKEYWERAGAPVMIFGLRRGDEPTQDMGAQPFEHQLLPHGVILKKRSSHDLIQVSYGFFKSKPGMVLKVEITNLSDESISYELSTRLAASLRTSHTSDQLKGAIPALKSPNQPAFAYFDGTATQDTCLFVANDGEKPLDFTSDPGIFDEWWQASPSGHVVHREAADSDPVIGFRYRKKLGPGESLSVVQLIGTTRKGAETELVRSLLVDHSYEEDVLLYDRFVSTKALQEGTIHTGLGDVDKTAVWAKGILAANAHYLDGEIVPMPCPAQYNFYFTHDVLMTDLAAVNFDSGRVKRDLDFIARHASKDGIIPHAYYWKDNHYETEMAGTDDWNHFWFVLVTARYLRHTGDRLTVEKLYPLLLKSVETALVNRKDDLIWAHRPDWWDIGKSFGPRSYMTLLAIRCLREFSFVRKVLGKGDRDTSNFESIADSMEKQLRVKNWDEEMGYLVNFNEGGLKDPHYYSGSLLALHFVHLGEDKAKKLLETARLKLLDSKVGIYNAYPMDFHHLTEFFKFAAGEAGAEFLYMNGGIWYQGNAWYALGLISNGSKRDALDFMRTVMTLDGIEAGPNGQFAMYEVRNGNKLDPARYGRVDKPQFLWAGAWYLYTLYNLVGLRENVWNISFDPFSFDPFSFETGAHFDVLFRDKRIRTTVSGSGTRLKSIRFDGTPVPSAVVPDELEIGDRIDLEMGIPEQPHLESTESILLSCEYQVPEKILTSSLAAFAGHRNKTRIISPRKPLAVLVNGRSVESWTATTTTEGLHEITVDFVHAGDRDVLGVTY